MCDELIEDEVHFLTECQLYGRRQHYWETIYDRVPQISNHCNTDKFIYIMTQDDPEITKIAIKTVYEWMTFRKFLHEYFFHQK